MANTNADESTENVCPIKSRTSSDGATAQGSGLWTGLTVWLPFRGQALGSGSDKRKPEEGAKEIEEGAKKMTEEGNLGGCPVQQNSRQAGSTKDPVQTYNPQTSDFVFGQERAPGQKIQLSTYFNAIKRKGHKTSERDIPSTLAIHNAVNEQGWAMVKEWEKLRAPGADPKLIRFCGRPQDVSPKAWIKTNLMGYRPPFDRHDWVVEREGREVRYVIDFYSGKPTREKPVALHLDVRPALDSAEAVFDRAHMLYHQDIRPILRGMGRALASGGSGTDQSPPKSSEDAPVPPPSTGVC